MSELLRGIEGLHGMVHMLSQSPGPKEYNDVRREISRLEKLASPSPADLLAWGGLLAARVNHYLRNSSSCGAFTLVTDGKRVEFLFLGVSVWETGQMDCPETYEELEAMVCAGLEAHADSVQELLRYFNG